MLKQFLRSLVGNRFIMHRGNEGDQHRTGLQPELARAVARGRPLLRLGRGAGVVERGVSGATEDPKRLVALFEGELSAILDGSSQGTSVLPVIQ